MSWEDTMVRMCEEDYYKTERKRKMVKVKKWYIAIAVSLVLVAVGFIAGMIAFGG